MDWVDTKPNEPTSRTSYIYRPHCDCIPVRKNRNEDAYPRSSEHSARTAPPPYPCHQTEPRSLLREETSYPTSSIARCCQIKETPYHQASYSKLHSDDVSRYCVESGSIYRHLNGIPHQPTEEIGSFHQDKGTRHFQMEDVPQNVRNVPYYQDDFRNSRYGSRPSTERQDLYNATTDTCPDIPLRGPRHSFTTSHQVEKPRRYIIPPNEVSGPSSYQCHFLRSSRRLPKCVNHWE